MVGEDASAGLLAPCDSRLTSDRPRSGSSPSSGARGRPAAGRPAVESSGGPSRRDASRVIQAASVASRPYDPTCPRVDAPTGLLGDSGPFAVRLLETGGPVGAGLIDRADDRGGGLESARAGTDPGGRAHDCPGYSRRPRPCPPARPGSFRAGDESARAVD